MHVSKHSIGQGLKSSLKNQTGPKSPRLLAPQILYPHLTKVQGTSWRERCEEEALCYVLTSKFGSG